MLPPLLATIFSDLGGCTMHCSCKTALQHETRIQFKFSAGDLSEAGSSENYEIQE